MLPLGLARDLAFDRRRATYEAKHAERRPQVASYVLLKIKAGKDDNTARRYHHSVQGFK